MLHSSSHFRQFGGWYTLNLVHTVALVDVIDSTLQFSIRYHNTSSILSSRIEVKPWDSHLPLAPRQSRAYANARVGIFGLILLKSHTNLIIVVKSEQKNIRYTLPSITDLEIAYALDAVRNGWGEHHRDYIDRFENSFKIHAGVNYAIATSSCTGALHMGLRALGIGPGDEVVLADTN